METGADLTFADPAERAVRQMRRLHVMVPVIREKSPFYRAKWHALSRSLAGVQLADLPLTTRIEIEADQAAQPPYGTNLLRPIDAYMRMHQTSGSGGSPLRWLDTRESWAWVKSCWAAVYAAAEVGKADRLAFAFSFGPFLGFWSAFESAVDAGWFCLPAGGMTTPARLRHICENAATVLCCTPTYALRLAEVAKLERIDIAASAIRAVIVAGEPGGSIPAVRDAIAREWGGRVFDHAGMTEIGPWGYECVPAPGGLHVHESEYIAEVLDPRSLQPVADGGSGELVLTNLGRVDSPLIRYRTGDVVSPRRGRCSCGRTTLRLEGGILGRTDDMLLIRGNSVFPSAVEALVRECAGLAEYRLVVEDRGALKDLVIEIESPGDAGGQPLTDRLTNLIRDRLHFAPRVVCVPAGSLPRFEMKAKRVVRRDV